jgi:hypothetical protein
LSPKEHLLIVTIIRSNRRFITLLAAGAAVALFSLTAFAQKADPKDPKNAELGVQLIKQAIEARGGARFLSFKTLEAQGQFTPFDKGAPATPVQFTDWIVFPDKERTDFGKGKKKNRKIQVNVGKTGWVYDGDAETLKDQTEKQIQAFLDELEFNIDRILRGGWQEPGVVVRFAGREELRPGERADVVSIELKPEQVIYLWLDRTAHLPISLIYEKSGEGRLIKNEVRFNQYVSYDGVKFPNIVDYYRDGFQETRANYQSIKLDVPISDEIFAKPASVKAIK